MKHEGTALRRSARWGARSAPRWFVRVAPVVLGVVSALLLGQTRAQVMRNLRRVYGRRGLAVEAHDCFQTFIRFAQCLAEGMAQGRPDCPTQAEVTGAEVLEGLRGSSQGLILVTAHFGPWDSAAYDLRRFIDRPLVLVMEREQNDESARVQDVDREMAGVAVLRLGTDPLDALPLLAHLEAGGIAAIQLDRAPEERPGLVGTLFGAPFPVPAGPLLLAGLAGVPLISVVSEWTGFFQRRVTVGQPVRVERRPSEGELAGALRTLLTGLEQRIAARPTQWFHFVGQREEERRIEEILRQRSAENRRHRFTRPGASGSHLAKAPP